MLTKIFRVMFISLHGIKRPLIPPDDILEDINTRERPDAIIQQQKAMQAARLRQQEVIDRKKDQKRQAALVGSDDMGFTTLNTAKRDRRTIEEIQKEIKSSKRQKH